MVGRWKETSRKKLHYACPSQNSKIVLGKWRKSRPQFRSMPTLHLVVALVKRNRVQFFVLESLGDFLTHHMLHVWITICSSMFWPLNLSQENGGKLKELGNVGEINSIFFQSLFISNMNSKTARVCFFECQLPLVYFMDIMDSLFDNSICVLFLHATWDSCELLVNYPNNVGILSTTLR